MHKIAEAYLNFRTRKLNFLARVYTFMAHYLPIWILEWLGKYSSAPCIGLTTPNSEVLLMEIREVLPPYDILYRRYKWEWKYHDWNLEIFQKYAALHFRTAAYGDPTYGTPTLVINGVVNRHPLLLTINLSTMSYKFDADLDFTEILFDRIEVPELLYKKLTKK